MTSIHGGFQNRLAVTLKQTVKELRMDLKKKEDELTEIKKTVKYTKIQEIEVFHQIK